MGTGFQTYVDDSLIGSGHIDHAGIYSLTDEVFWALSAGFTPSPEEMGVIVGIFKGDDVMKDRAFSDGLYVAGNRYILTRAESRSIYARSGRAGIAAAKANRTVIVGYHSEKTAAGDANTTVESLADYLTGQGY